MDQSASVTVGPKGGDRSKLKSYAYVGKGRKSPVQLTAPTEPGQCEVRYVGRGGRILATAELNVTPAEVTMDVPAKLVPGSTV